MRTFRRRRFVRRGRRIGRRSRKMRRMMMIRRRIKKFVNKMGYPTYVKMIGMTESKRLILRKTLTLDALYSTEGNHDNDHANTNIFQIVLNPLECPNISKVFSTITIKVPNSKGENVESTYDNIFRYDYLKIRNIFISIKPAQSVSTMNTNVYSDNAADSGISNVYAYFTYRYPMLSPNDIKDTIESMYGTNPLPDRIVQEGRTKNVYTWPSNKAMTISLNSLKYRVVSEPYKICANGPLDIQYLSTLSPTASDSATVYDPFNFMKMKDTREAERELEEEGNENMDSYDESEYGVKQDEVLIPDLKTKDYNLFFGRLVIVSPKKVRFTTEICYDCVMYR